MLIRRVAFCSLLLVFAGSAFETNATGGVSEARPGHQAPGQDQIIVVMTCSQNQGAGVRVNPFRRHLASDATATFRQVGGYRGTYTIEPVDPFPWTLSNGGVSDGNGEVTATPLQTVRLTETTLTR